MNHSEREALYGRLWRLRLGFYVLQVFFGTILYTILGLLGVSRLLDIIISTIFIAAIWGICACFETSRILLLGSIDSALDIIESRKKEAEKEVNQTLPPITR